MALLIIVLGLLMAGAGAFFIVLGFDIVMTERGAAMTIAGTVALAGGVVTLGLGCAILRLTQMLRALEVRGALPAPPLQPAELQDNPAPAAVSAANTMTGTALAAGTAVAATAGLAALARGSSDHTPMPGAPDQPDDGEGALLFADDPSAHHADAATSIAAEVPEPPAVVPSLNDGLTEARATPDLAQPGSAGADLDDDIFKDLDVLLNQTGNATDILQPETDDLPAPVLSDPDLGNTPDDADAEDALQDGEADAPRVAPGRSTPSSPDPQVLGSYNAGGRIYTMYSDGSVEAVTTDGVERFPSMDSLREHLART